MRMDLAEIIQLACIYLKPRLIHIPTNALCPKAIENLNIHHLSDIEDWVYNRGIESYRHEIAEQRVEFHNIGDPITLPPDVYERLTLKFAEKIIRNIKKKTFLTRTTEAIRVAYYDVAIQILKQRRQVTPCYGGLSNIHLNYNGDIWPCCILGAEKNLGNVRGWNYDMQALMASDQAKKSRKYIADKNCACPLANQWLTNVLLTPRHMLKALYNLFVRFPFSKTEPVNEHQSRTVDPAKTRANIAGTSSRQALLLCKAGTIPKPEMVYLPEFGENGEVKYPVSSRFLSLLEKEKKITTSS